MTALVDRARRMVAAAPRRWRRHHHPVDVTLPGGGILRWREDDRYPATMLEGTYEPELVAHLRERLEPGSTLLDLGANSGYLAFVAKAVVGDTGRVVAVEPHPENLATLDDRRQLNPQLPVEVVRAAVAPVVGTVTLHLTRNLANGRIDTAGWSHEKPAVGACEVPARTLDDLIVECAPDVVKVDIEGAEGAVLDASYGPTAWPTQPVFLVEYHGDENRERCLAAVRQWGWIAREESRASELPAGLLVVEPPR